MTRDLPPWAEEIARLYRSNDSGAQLTGVSQATAQRLRPAHASEAETKNPEAGPLDCVWQKLFSIEKKLDQLLAALEKPPTEEKTDAESV